MSKTARFLYLLMNARTTNSILVYAPISKRISEIILCAL
jgi:hypothetical protein